LVIVNFLAGPVVLTLTLPKPSEVGVKVSAPGTATPLSATICGALAALSLIVS